MFVETEALKKVVALYEERRGLWASLTEDPPRIGEADPRRERCETIEGYELSAAWAARRLELCQRRRRNGRRPEGQAAGRESEKRSGSAGANEAWRRKYAEGTLWSLKSCGKSHPWCAKCRGNPTEEF